jgi:hypothetical protein
MDIDTLIKLLQNFAFPVVVAAYLLVRIEPVLQRIAEVNAAQLELMRQLTDRLTILDGHIDKHS